MDKTSATPLLNNSTFLSAPDVWIAGEENLRPATIFTILKEVLGLQLDLNTDLKIEPLLDGNTFLNLYEISGLKIKGINKVYYELVSGCGSFVDYVVAISDTKPASCKEYTQVIEENSTRPSDAGNMTTQRLTKFVYSKIFYPYLKNLTFLNIIPNFKKEKLPKNYIRNCRLYNTLGVKAILCDQGGNDKSPPWNPYISIEELLCEHSPVIKPRTDYLFGIERKNDSIYINAKLRNGKKGMLSDPNVGYCVAIAYICKRIFNFEGDIIIENHKLSENWFNKTRSNKLIQICDKLQMKFRYLSKTISPTCGRYPIEKYFVTEVRGEKKVSILHEVISNNKGVKTIYSNHAGCERGYFITSNGEHKQVPKNIKIPDLVTIDQDKKEIFVYEAEMYDNYDKGVKQIRGFGKFIKFIQRYYPDYKIKKHITLNGGKDFKDNVAFQILDNNKWRSNEEVRGY